MSLILEALKKSEDRRRLGAAPDLATPFSAPRRRNWLWPVAGVLIVVGVIAWALRPSAPPPQAPAAAVVPPKTAAPTVAATPVPGQKSGTPLHSVTGNNDQVQTAPPPRLPKPPPTLGMGGKFVPGQPDPGQSVADVPKSNREIFEDMRQRGAEIAKQREAIRAAAQPPKAADKAPRGATMARRVTPAAPPAAPPAPVAAPPPAAPAVVVAPAPPPKAEEAAARAPKSSSTVGLTPPPAEQPATQVAKAAPATTSSAQPYAELPFGVRKSMPELRLSMHVYAADPSHRFVVINDSRLTEGEKTSDDLFVREIRPDGVVLEFQNQRFFYPRDGL
jgi:general secretion pathway protein B